MPLSGASVVSMIAPVIGHQLITQDTAWITLQPLGKDSLERVVVSVLLENSGSGIATVQGVINKGQ